MINCKKKLFLSVFVALFMSLSWTLSCVASSVQKFWDVPKDYWAFDYISDLARRGVIKGYDDGSFKPDITVSRAEWAKMMVDAAGIVATDNSVYFKDLSSAHWANKYVNAAKQYMTGYRDGTFRPDQAATREDVAIALVLIKGYDIAEVDYSNLYFTDNSSISNYAKAYVAVAVQHGLIAGFSDGSFRGQDTLTRAQAAALLYRGFQQGGADKVIGGVVTNGNDSEHSDLTTEQEYMHQADSADRFVENHITENKVNDTEAITASVSLRTLVDSLSIDSIYEYTCDDEGNIYYLDDPYIRVVNVDGDTVEDFQYIPDLDIFQEDIILTGFNVSNLCWDNSDDQLIIQGEYDTINCADPESVVNSFLIKSPGPSGDSLSLVSACFSFENNPTWKDRGSSRIVTTTSDGSLVTNYQLIDSDADDLIANIVESSSHWVTDYEYTCNAIDCDDGIYYVSKNDNNEYHHELCCYDYVSLDSIFSFKSNAYGLSDSSLYLVKDDAFEKYDFDGNLLGGVLFKDIDILDSRPLNSDNMLEKLIVSEDWVVFYDTSLNGFRMLN